MRRDMRWTRDNDSDPIPVLRRAPALSSNHGEPTVQRSTAGDAATASAPVNLRRSISHRISRVATAAMLGRSLSTSLRRPQRKSDAGQQQPALNRRDSDVQDGVRIRKVGGDDASRTRPVSPVVGTPGAAATTPRLPSEPGEDDDNDDDGAACASDPTAAATMHAEPKSCAANRPQNAAPRGNLVADVPVPAPLQQGVPMTKVSAKSQKSYLFKLDADQGQIIWESKRLRIIPIENIKELRSGPDARYYRQQFQLAREYEDRWITIIYMLDGQYKTLHLIASSSDTFHLWDITLRKLYAIRQELMTGPGNEEIRQAVWIKQCWKATSGQGDNQHTLSFEQVEKLCRRLNINSSQEDLMRLFKSADSQNRQHLDFADFQTFVKLLKARPDIDILFKKLCLMGNGKLTFAVFECFMHDTQKSSLTQPELQHLFMRYSTRTLDAQGTTSAQDPARLTMSLDAFTAFLLSSDNSAFIGQAGKVYHSMTHPLCDYFISSSHNTYLVGNQLVGSSTIEGYIRALLQGCRSVELDVYDGEHEPVVYHGKTLTSKVSAREVCEAIIKYAFVTSPYPIIISAEIHCSLAQQDLLAAIMHEVFGEALVNAPIQGKQLSGPLPSPEDLKGRILLKAKNLYVSESEPIHERVVTFDTESSSTEPSASDSDVAHEIKEEFKKVKLRELEAVKELKEEFRKARNVFNRVRGRHSSSEKSIAMALAGATTATSTAVVEQLPRSESKPERKAKMSAALVALLVYTVGVKCRGINKKEHYAPEHMFSLSETTMNKVLKQGTADLIKHNKTHLIRTYPKGTRVSSTNYLPHRYWAAGAQLVAINWQTFDLGYMINRAMFQRNGRVGYVLKPEVLRKTEDPRRSDKEYLYRLAHHYLEVTVISAQQLPRPKDASGHEIGDRHVDPYVEVSIYTPDWSLPATTPSSSLSPSSSSASSSSSSSSVGSHAAGHTHAHATRVPQAVTTMRTSAVKNNGFNPVWQETLRLPFSCFGDMRALAFVKFTIHHDGDDGGGGGSGSGSHGGGGGSGSGGGGGGSGSGNVGGNGSANGEHAIAGCCVSLGGGLAMGYRHLPLYDAQASQYLFSTLFVRCAVHDA